jgi:hypothetical protein
LHQTVRVKRADLGDGLAAAGCAEDRFTLRFNLAGCGDFFGPVEVSYTER